MGIATKLLNFSARLTWALAAIFFYFSDIDHSFAQTPELDELFDQLQDPEVGDWKKIETLIWEQWSRSGSASSDLLLQRGRRAIAEGRLSQAVSHFTALIDHAPEFAEGWNARATTFYLMQEFGLSVFDINQTLALNPRHFGAMAGLAAILEQTGDLKAALKAYKSAQAVHPFRPDVNDAIARLEAHVNGSDL